MTLYNPPVFTNEYLNSRITLELCMTKYFNNNIIKIIDSFLINYSTGFALYNYNKLMRCGHPIEPILKILSSFNITTSDVQFNNFLQEINNVPNKDTIDLSNVFKYMISKYNMFEQELNNASDVFVLYFYINKYIGFIHINKTCKIIKYLKMASNEYSKNISLGSLLVYLKHYSIDNLTDYLIKISQYNTITLNNFNNILWYEKKLIINHNILFFEISRLTFYNNKVTMIYDKFELPNKLILPPFVFDNNESKNYELIAIIIYEKYRKNKYKYSYIIKKNNNFYHFKYNKIIILNDSYFKTVVWHNAIGAFYKMI